MSEHRARNRRRWTALLLTGGLGAAAAWAVLQAPGGGMDTNSQGPRPAAPPTAAEWKAVDAPIRDQRYQEAADLVAALRKRAQAAGDAAGWTRGIVLETRLRMGLHGYETAVEQLRAWDWPDDPLQRAVLELYYGDSLVQYLNAYGWEIGQRETVAGGGNDLRGWTRREIADEAARSFDAAWQRRESWGGESVGILSDYIQSGDYPAAIRGTLRDAVSYLYAELLADSGHWEPAQSQAVYGLDVEVLAGGDLAALRAALDEASAHPLARAAGVMADLEAWHRAAGRDEAAFEALRTRLTLLHTHVTDAGDRAVMRRSLTAAAEALGSRKAWWTMGQATLVEWTRDLEAPDAAVMARDLASQCVAEGLASVGRERCASLLAQLEAPSFRVEGMRSDGARQRSLRLHHRNLPQLHWRAFAVDFDSRLTATADRSLLPEYRDVPQILRRSPSAAWSTELPATPDLREHATDVTPPLDQPGLYVLVASARPDFAERSNSLQAVNFLLTDLVLVNRGAEDGLRVEARSGASGEALAGVEVALYRYDWQRSHQQVTTATTGADGSATLRPEERWRHFVVARQGDQRALLTDFGWTPPEDADAVSAALVYTDRSVYRPQQPLHWKVVAYGGRSREGRFQIDADATLRVELVDGNGEVVETQEVRTNRHGSASGTFSVPAGRLLGDWQVRTDRGAAATVRVEEYKRPTFEVEIAEPEGELRLNREARLTGEARYYFGLPVTAGEVTWRVLREPRYPRWWWWWSPPAAAPQVIDAGTARLDADGRFAVAFTPAADERLAGSGISYGYRLNVDVTDEGGETRSAQRSFRLGFVAVEAQFDELPGYVAVDAATTWALRRQDLDGAPRAGEGSWTLHRLVEPAAALLPADQPLPPALGPDGQERESGYTTEGDRRRPRWQAGYQPQEVLRLWEDGPEVATAAVVHDASGTGDIELPALPAGAYRLHYRTQDGHGAEFTLRHEFVVSGAGEAAPALPALLAVEAATVPVGGTARLLVASGLADQELSLEILRFGRVVERRRLHSEGGTQVVEIPVTAAQRGGFSAVLSALRDHQWMRLTTQVVVPWDDRRLELEMKSFRDRLRPKDRETWTVRLRGAAGATLEEGAAELLAYMYDRSLDLFAPHQPPRPLELYPSALGAGGQTTSLGSAPIAWSGGQGLARIPDYPYLTGARLQWLDRYPIGGVGPRGRMYRMAAGAPAPMADGVAMEAASAAPQAAPDQDVVEIGVAVLGGMPPPPPALPEGALRTDFSETAFWEPHLLVGPDGEASFQFTVPDSATEWNLWVHALTTDLRAGTLETRARSVKDLLVRPYLPRFLREGDRAELRVAVDNAGEVPLSGTVRLEIFDPETEEDLLPAFGLGAGQALARFEAAAGRGTTLRFDLTAPQRVGPTVVRVSGVAGDLADGEQRALPLLPGRMHLAQSRFVALHDSDQKTVRFDDLAAADDPTLQSDQLVVTVDAQLFATVLSALPYLVDYPYECTEQTMNRFLSTGIVSSVFERHPAVAAMAAEMAAGRDSRFEQWNPEDPNRRMALEETPWLVQSRGGAEETADLLRILDPEVARAQRDSAIARLRESQTAGGAFPWFPGGPPSPYMTLYLLYGFSKGLEHEVPVPQDLVQRAWSYLHSYYIADLARDMRRDECCFETVTFLNYVLSSYPDTSWTGGVFSDGERREMLAYSWRHWRRLSPLVKAQLALTLERAGRSEDAWTVFASILDSAKSDEMSGLSWAPEERAWLWYNDTVDSHAFILRALDELRPDDERRHGLVQWLLVNKKLNHWKSTRATAEVIHALVAYLEREGALGVREAVTVTAGPRTRSFVFEPERYSGKGNQMVIPGEEVTPAMAAVTVSKDTPGFLFASATWHYSTERLPEAADGDLLGVERRYFRRVADRDGWRLEPLTEGTRVEVGDMVEVHLSLTARHAAEYVHLQDPRAAGFEPETQQSRHRWDLGIAWFEEVRDSATNFFIEQLPAGEYTLKYRLRASMAGSFRVGPATVQSMYAPEFAAHSGGHVLELTAD